MATVGSRAGALPARVYALPGGCRGAQSPAHTQPHTSSLPRALSLFIPLFSPSPSLFSPYEQKSAGRMRKAEPKREKQKDVCSYLCFWKRIAGIVIAVSVILLLMWFSLNPPRLLQLEPCPDDWLYYKKKCYYDSGAAADWDSSRKFCSAHGASLVVIDNCQELNFIIYRIHTTDFWIGLYKRGNEFFWVNGESFDTDLFHVNTSDDGDCVHIDIQPLTPPEAAPHSRAGFAPLVSLIPTQTPSRAQLAM
uniref:C-type lectin domain-containing protein n=2 Tax=Apteryx owenii TaxID=8824 RepID=A0A8B9S2N3_APTOW